MQTVRYLTSMGRPVGPSIVPGDVADVSADEAHNLVAAGFAEIIGRPQPKELDPINIDGSVKELTAWVGEDVQRALRVLELERNRPNPRVTLVRQLEAIAEK